MTMTYDVAAALFGRRTDGQTQTQAGAQTSSTTVRHGTAAAASANGWVEVVLDGSTDPLIVYTELDVVKDQRVSVIMQGGVYKVVSLGAIPSDIKAAVDAANDATQAAKDAVAAVEQAKADIAEARKTATNYLTFDESTGLNISNVADTADDKANLNVDAYGVEVRRGTKAYASFGEVTTVGPEDGYHTQIDTNGVSTNNGTKRLGTLASYPGSEQFYIYGNGGVQILSDNGSDAGASIKAGNVRVGLGGYGMSCVKPAGSAMTTTVGSTGRLSMFGSTMSLRGLAVCEYDKDFMTGVHVSKNAGIVIVDFAGIQPGYVAVSTTKVLGTLGAGFRPSHIARGALIDAADGSEGMFALVRPSGSIEIFAGQGLGGNESLNGQVVFHATA